MTGGVKRTLDEMEDFGAEEPEDLNTKILDLLGKFEGKDLVFITKFFKVIYKNNEPNLAISHPRIQKKAGLLSYNLTFKGTSLRTDCAALTNLDSDIMSGRGNTGPAFCTLVPLKDLSDEVNQKVLDKFNMEIVEQELPSTNSQDFPFTQSLTEETLKVCQVCRFATRDKTELREHMQMHYKCDTCSQYYLTDDDLQHHVQNHKKVECDQCSQEIRKDEMLNHKMNHLKLKSFGKKVVKTKVIKPVTGYGLWQKDARKRIIEEHPDMIYTEVGRELGKRWALVGIAQRNVLKKQAEDFNKSLREQTGEPDEPSTSSTSSGLEPELVSERLEPSTFPTDDPSTSSTFSGLEPELVPEVIMGDDTNAAIDDMLNTTNDNHLDADQLLNITIETINISSEEPARKRKKTGVLKTTDCPLCDFIFETTEGLADHMHNLHHLMQSTLKSCTICRKIFMQESKLKEHMELEHLQVVQNQDEGENNDVGNLAEAAVVVDDNHDEVAEAEVVLVRLRKLAWPAIVLKRENDIIEVKMLSDDAIKVISANDIEEFDVEKILNTKNSRLKNAFAKAVEIQKK